MELWELGPGDLVDSYRAGTTSPAEVVASLLERIGVHDPAVGAFRQVFAEEAIERASALALRAREGDWAGPLHGVPVAIKELFDVEDGIGCYGSRVLLDRVSPADALVVKRLRDAGAIVLGITRSHEFGWGITTQHDSLGSTVNPWDSRRVPGGSSGGSAAALAMGMVPLAVGSDTGGSIRIPAAFCGVAGVKPTYGRVPKVGGVALAPSLDHPGPMARTVSDLVPALEVMSGHAEEDPSTMREAPLRLGRLGAAEEVVLGISADLHLTALADDHQAVFDQLTRDLESAGARLVSVSVPGAGDIRPAFGTIQMAEAYRYHTTVLGTFPDRADQYGADVRRRLELAAEVSDADHEAASRERALIDRRLSDAVSTVHALLTPISATGPSLRSEPDVVDHRGGKLPFRDAVMDYTVLQDLVGFPAVAVPVGLDDSGMPVGVQLTAPRGEEATALRAAMFVESVAGATGRWPTMSGER